MSRSQPAADYEVGYGRPPVNTRFKKGQSGNPAGRRKGVRTVNALIKDALEERVVVTIKGQRQSISKLEAAAIQMANQAAAGDRHAIKLALDVLSAAEAQEEALRAGAPTMTAEQRLAEDKKLLENMRQRMRALESEPNA